MFWAGPNLAGIGGKKELGMLKKEVFFCKTVRISQPQLACYRSTIWKYVCIGSIQMLVHIFLLSIPYYLFMKMLH